MPVCGSGACASSSYLLIRGAHVRRRQAENPLISLCRFARPALFFPVHPRAVVPGREGVEAFPVTRPAIFSLVDAAIEGQPVAGFVFDDPGLLVKDAIVLNWPSVEVAGHGNLHVKEALR